METDVLFPGMAAMTKRELEAASMRRLRLMRGWSLRQVAERAGVNVSQIYRSEHGQRKPLTMYQMAGIFEVPVDQVLIPCPHCGYSPPAGYICATCHQGGGQHEGHLVVKE